MTSAVCLISPREAFTVTCNVGAKIVYRPADFSQNPFWDLVSQSNRRKKPDGSFVSKHPMDTVSLSKQTGYKGTIQTFASTSTQIFVIIVKKSVKKISHSAYYIQTTFRQWVFAKNH